ncbi:MAG: hypothetical protein DMD89_19585 [Candidatus Rokuibacteriota bacterium]|nr:MAG: hypothetical protein DMD89_19585 [Candidatus Rokubacteria bacterium]
MANLIRVVLVSFLLAILYVDPAEADGFDGAFWLIQYEHADQAWNNVAVAYVLGVLDGGPRRGKNTTARSRLASRTFSSIFTARRELPKPALILLADPVKAAP